VSKRKQRAWSKKEEDLLRSLYARKSLPDLARMFKRSACAVKSRAGVLGLKRSNRKYWTAEDLKLFVELYPHTSNKEIGKRLGRSEQSINAASGVYGLRKSAEYLARQNAELGKQLNVSGAAHRFPKGHVPANKGTRRPGWAPGRMASTQFKKGRRAGAAQAKWVPIGTVKMNADGYLRRKIADEPEEIAGKGAHSTNWEFVHRRVWEDAHGPIPEGYRIWWKDGNHWNCALENLELLSGKEHMRRTTVHGLPQPLKEVIQLKGSINRQITMKTRKAASTEARA
jgi:HNH endonuclease